MRIIHWIKQFYPFMGGGETLLYYLSKEIELFDWINENIIITSRLPETKKAEKLFRKTKIIRVGFPINYEKPLTKNPFSKLITSIKTSWRDFQLARMLLKLNIGSNDILHIHGPMSLTPISRLFYKFGMKSIITNSFYLRPWLFLAKKKNVKLISHFHSLGWDIRGNKKMWKFSEIEDSKYSKKIIAVDKVIIDGFKKILPETDFKKTVFIPNGVDINVFKPMDKEKCRKKLGLPLNCNVISFIGRLDPLKGCDMLIKSVRNMKNTLTLIIGTGPEEAKLKGLSGKNILFVGKVENEKLPSYYCASDIIVNPLRFKAISRVQLEAMACSRITIKSDMDKTPVEDGKNGFVFKTNSCSDLKKKIKFVLNFNAKAKNKVEINARKTIVNHYDIKKLSKKIIDIYRS